MIALLAYFACVIAIAGLTCGHQGEPFPLARAARYALAWRAHRSSCGSRVTPATQRAARRRARRSVPSWAHTEPYDYEQAA